MLNILIQQFKTAIIKSSVIKTRTWKANNCAGSNPYLVPHNLAHVWNFNILAFMYQAAFHQMHLKLKLYQSLKPCID